jgi:hypothetical protein
MTFAEIDQLAEKMEKEIKAFKSELFKLCWFMRGGLTIEQAYDTDFQDRETIVELIKENLDTTKKSGLPFF